MSFQEFPSFASFFAFIGASFALAIVPGPAVVFTLARTLSEGRVSGIASLIGIALGNLCNAVGATVGLSVLFTTFPISFLLVKYAGAMYLAYMGLMALRAKTNHASEIFIKPSPAWKIIQDGFWVAFLNPKTTIFFAAFLPQFISSESSFIGQSLFLALTFVVVAALIDTMYVFTASSIYPALARRSGKISSVGKYLTAGSFLFLAGFSAFAS